MSIEVIESRERADTPDPVRELLNAARAKLADCARNGGCGGDTGCSDAALMPGEMCSQECVDLSRAVEAFGNSVVKKSLSTDPVRDDTDDGPDLTPEQEAELQDEFNAWKAARAVRADPVRADPVRDELLAALSSAEQRFRTIGMGTCEWEHMTRGNMRATCDIAMMGESECRAAIARAESPAPAQEKQPMSETLKLAQETIDEPGSASRLCLLFAAAYIDIHEQMEKIETEAPRLVHIFGCGFYGDKSCTCPVGRILALTKGPQ